MPKYENTNLINREREQLLSAAEQLWHSTELLGLLKDPKTQLESNEKRVKLNQAVARELEKKQSNKETISEATQSTETQTDTFCGIAINQITKTQQKLFDKLTPDQREELTQKVSINKQEGQIEFLQLKKAIKDTDTVTGVNKKGADDAIKKLGNGWELPRDVDYTDSNRLTLNTKKSDYDAMILQMPGATDNEKVENFRLLTDMSWWYRTTQNYNKSSSRFVVRDFYENGRGRYRVNNGIDDYPVRPVRSL